MKKQFFRVKQLADQRFSRAEKTEVLTDDLQSADKHVEQIRNALNGLSKRLGSPPSQTTAQDPAYKEKRLKKCSEYILGQTMLDNSSDEGLLGFVLTKCGDTQIALAIEAIEHESKVEQFVVTPIQQILDTDVPNIVKHKRNLAKLILDMDSARTRYMQAIKHSNNGGTAATKVDSLREELEEAETKVEQCRDQLAAEMFQLMSKETEIAQRIIQYVKLQRAYHESALHCLEELIPGLECYINDNEMKPVYGHPLEEHLRVTNRKIALPIQLCVSALLKIGMEEEGLFRIAGGASKLRRIKLSFDACCLNLHTALEYKDPHLIAGALKSYLRELPEPLLTYKLYSEWMTASKIIQNDVRLQAIWEVLHKLPQINYDNLRYLIKFLAKLTTNCDVNKMSPQNIAIVIAPNLIWAPQEDKNNMVMNMSTANNSSQIVDQLVTYADWFFPEDIDFESDLDIGIVNGTDNNITSGMHKCISTGSLNDNCGESPPQGSPKPATRRKNKLAPTPPNLTPDKNFDKKNIDDKVFLLPSAPDKPPRPLTTSTLNRYTYKALKSEANNDLTSSNYQQNHDKDNKIDKKNETTTFEVDNNKSLIEFNSINNNNNDDESIEQTDNETTKTDNEIEKIHKNSDTNIPIGFESINAASISNKTIENDNNNDTHKFKPILAEKPTTLERRRMPVAAPRTTITNTDENVELRKKNDGQIQVDRNSKPAIPERPAGLPRPSSLIRPHPRQSNENLDLDLGSMTLERAHMYSVDKQQVSIIQLHGNNQQKLINESNGNSSSILQRSPSVGSRPTSVSLADDNNIKQSRPDIPDQNKTHTRTRSEGNIIDVQTQTSTIIVTKTPQNITQQQPVSPRFYQRPPRPQPPPPPPPTNRPKSEYETTNL